MKYKSLPAILLLVAGYFLFFPSPRSIHPGPVQEMSSSLSEAQQPLPESHGVHIGDKVGSFTVESIQYMDASEYDIKLSGQATVEGRVYEYVYDEKNTGELCFEVIGKTASSIPRLAEDARRPWFCFENGNVVRQQLKRRPSGGQANIRVVIEGYNYRFRPKDLPDEATFIRIVE